MAVSPAARAENPFGVALWPAPGQDLSLMAARAGALEVAWFRPPTLYVDRWRPESNCPSCRALAKTGLSVALVVRNTGRDAPPRRPSAPPEDVEAYARIVGAMLDQWHPALLVVEEEENRLYRFAGTAVDYRKELETACKASHQRGIPCANGGLSYEAVTAATWLQLLKDGKPDIACDYAKRAFYERFGTVCSYRRAGDVPPDLREKLLQGADALLPIYKTAVFLDSVNFRWNGGDAVALAQTIEAIGRVTGKPVISTDFSLRRSDSDPRHVRPVMRAAMAGGMKVAIWTSADGEDSTALFDEQGRLRPAGQEFAHQMSGRK
ncbi:MAG TPA: hypothetical protein VKP60_20015 [Magnetospirillaceae bacterium]|nr:hypothetical protein [Magnetospirillaceae bacterium]